MVALLGDCCFVAEAPHATQNSELEKINSDNPPSTIVLDRPAASDAPAVKVEKIGQWPELQRTWEQAQKGYGIIFLRAPGMPDRLRLDVWRASTNLPKYIACIEEKHKAIGRIWQKCRSFTQRKDASHPLSILLEADPAVGKTFLAETLAGQLDCQFVKHDITPKFRDCRWAGPATADREPAETSERARRTA